MRSIQQINSPPRPTDRISSSVTNMMMLQSECEQIQIFPYLAEHSDLLFQIISSTGADRGSARQGLGLSSDQLRTTSQRTGVLLTMLGR